MNCHQVRDLIEKHADGELAATRVLEMEAHIVSCTDCRAAQASTGSTLTGIQKRFEIMPNLKAAPDFDQRVMEAVLPRLAQRDSFFDRLDAIFARPLYNLLGSTALGIFLGLLTLAAVLLSQSLEGSTVAPSGSTVSTAIVREARLPDRFYAAQGLSPDAAYIDPMRELYPIDSTPPRRRQSGRRGSSWDAATSELSYSSPSGSLC